MDQTRPRSQAQEVLGTAVLTIVPVHPGSLPQPPIDLVLRIKERSNGNDLDFDIADGSAVWDLMAVGPQKAGSSVQNFRLMLPPGEYSISGFGVRARSLSDRVFFVPSDGPTFTVPENRCFYIGRINSTFWRLAPGSLKQAQAASADVSATLGGKPLLMVYLPHGSLLWMTAFVDQPPEDGHAQAGTYSRQVLAYARQKECAFLMTPKADQEEPRSLKLEAQLGTREGAGKPTERIQ
jgi:hypothetical protein